MSLTDFQLLATIGSGSLVGLGLVAWAVMSIKAAVREGSREVVGALEHDNRELVRLRAEFELLRAATMVETTRHTALSAETRRRAHLRAV